MTSNSKFLAKRVVIGGCGRAGAALTSALCESGSIVHALDIVPSAFDRIAPDLIKSGRAYPRLADVTLPSSLWSARAQDADIFIALTGNDAVNAMAAQIAHHIFRVPTVICRMDDPIKRNMYNELEIATISYVEFARDMVAEIVSNGGAGA